MNSSFYIKMLSESFIPFSPEYFILQRDNAPCYIAKSTTELFQTQNIVVLTWPSRSPGFNPIENLPLYQLEVDSRT